MSAETEDAEPEASAQTGAEGKARGLGGSGAAPAVAVDHGPTKMSSVAAVVSAFLAGLTSGPFGLLAIPLALGGIGMIAGGLFYKPNTAWVSLGTVALYLSAVLSAMLGGPVEVLLVSVVATFMAWHFGRRAIDLGQQIGRHSTTRRNEAMNISIVTIFGFGSAAIGFGVYTFTAAGRPVAAVGLLALAALFLSWATRT